MQQRRFYKFTAGTSGVWENCDNTFLGQVVSMDCLSAAWTQAPPQEHFEGRWLWRGFWNGNGHCRQWPRVWLRRRRSGRISNGVPGDVGECSRGAARPAKETFTTSPSSPTAHSAQCECREDGRRLLDIAATICPHALATPTTISRYCGCSGIRCSLGRTCSFEIQLS